VSIYDANRRPAGPVVDWPGRSGVKDYVSKRKRRSPGRGDDRGGKRAEKASKKKRTISSYRSKKKESTDDQIVHFEWYRGMKLSQCLEVCSQLGEGTFGRVLECWDCKESRRVAVKVVRDVDRYTSAARIEAQILQEIRQKDPSCGSKCVEMFECFIYQKRHMCLVFEKLGLSLYDFLSQNFYKGFFVSDIREFGRQSLQALHFMRRIKLTHTDLKPENILLVHNDYEWVPFPRGTGTVKRPKCPDIKIIDFGSATFEDEYHCSIINTRQYRAPEVILDIGWSMSSDVWSLGCILMELYTGVLLFKTHEHLEHLAMIEKIIAPLPTAMVDAALDSEGRKYMDKKEKRLNWPAGAASSNSIRRVKECCRLEDLVPAAHRPLASFVRFLLELDPEKRPTPEQALQHPFFFCSLQ